MKKAFVIGMVLISTSFSSVVTFAADAGKDKAGASADMSKFRDEVRDAMLGKGVKSSADLDDAKRSQAAQRIAENMVSGGDINTMVASLTKGSKADVAARLDGAATVLAYKKQADHYNDANEKAMIDLIVHFYLRANLLGAKDNMTSTVLDASKRKIVQDAYMNMLAQPGKILASYDTAHRDSALSFLKEFKTLEESGKYSVEEALWVATLTKLAGNDSNKALEILKELGICK